MQKNIPNKPFFYALVGNIPTFGLVVSLADPSWWEMSRGRQLKMYRLCEMAHSGYVNWVFNNALGYIIGHG
jgi:hypothetical protein